MAADVAFSCAVSTVGLVLPFILTDPPSLDGVTGSPISNALHATAVWLTQTGARRVLTLSNAQSAVFTYTLSMGDTRSPRLEEGYIEVSISGAVFPSSSFCLHIVPHF